MFQMSSVELAETSFIYNFLYMRTVVSVRSFSSFLKYLLAEAVPLLLELASWLSEQKYACTPKGSKDAATYSVDLGWRIMWLARI